MNTSDTIDRRTLADQVYARLREKIVAGDYASNAAIRQEAIALELGVSKIPLREALARLEQDGLVSSHPHRGFIVRALTTEEAEDLFDLRLRLEPELTAQGAAKASAAQQESARAAQDLWHGAIAAHGRNIGEANRAFHMALVEPTARPISNEFLRRLHILSERYVRVHLDPAGREARAHKEHGELMDAWLARDIKTTHRLAYEHIAGTLNDLRIQLAAEPAQK